MQHFYSKYGACITKTATFTEPCTSEELVATVHYLSYSKGLNLEVNVFKKIESLIKEVANPLSVMLNAS
jgi:hypothetical protein